MDKNIANKVLGWLKIILKDPPVEYDNLYSTMSVPQPIKSLGYEEEHLKSSLSDCNPCYDEGEEVDYEILDFENIEWDISDIEQITEDINRVKEVMGLKLVL